MADEQALRREAVRWRLGGERPEEIAAELGRSTRWVRKWVARFRQGRADWAVGRSRAPARRAQRTAARIEGQVVEARRRLEADPRTQRGAWPSPGSCGCGGPILLRPPPRAASRGSSPGRGWPSPAAGGDRLPRPRPSSTRSLEFPRPAARGRHGRPPPAGRGPEGPQPHRQGRGHLHRVALQPLARQRPIWLAQHLVVAWRRLGLPATVQVASASRLRGAIGDPRTFGPVVRTSLNLGAVVRHIPQGSPAPRRGAIPPVRR